MAFNKEAFLTARFHLRTAFVDVPELAGMFDDGEKAVFEVRGLDGVEWGLAKERIQKRRDLALMMQKIASGDPAKVAEAVNASLGLKDKLAAESALLLECFQVGVVSPELNEVDALNVSKKLLKHFPDAFDRIARKIVELTGASDQGEARGSGESPKSGPQ